MRICLIRHGSALFPSIRHLMADIVVGMTLPKRPPQRKPRGRHPQNALTPAFVRNVSRAGRYCDGNGLYLDVRPTGSRGWIQRLTIRGRRTELGVLTSRSARISSRRPCARRSNHRLIKATSPPPPAAAKIKPDNVHMPRLASLSSRKSETTRNNLSWPDHNDSSLTPTIRQGRGSAIVALVQGPYPCPEPAAAPSCGKTDPRALGRFRCREPLAARTMIALPAPLPHQVHRPPGASRRRVQERRSTQERVRARERRPAGRGRRAAPHRPGARPPCRRGGTRPLPGCADRVHRLRGAHRTRQHRGRIGQLPGSLHTCQGGRRVPDARQRTGRRAPAPLTRRGRRRRSLLPARAGRPGSGRA